VAFAILRRHFAAMVAHEPGVRLGEDPEELGTRDEGSTGFGITQQRVPDLLRHAGAGAGHRAGVGLAVGRSCSAYGTGCKQWVLEVPKAARLTAFGLSLYQSWVKWNGG
jgi:hypothetical protein